MKKIFTLMIAAVAVFAGCEKEKDEEPAVPPLEVSPETVAATAAAGTYPIAVTSNGTWTATVDAAATWCTVSPASGTNNGTVTVNVAKNLTTETRAATVTFSAGTFTTAVPVTQAAATGTPGTPETAQITMTVVPDESRELKFYASAQQLVVDWGDGHTETFTNVTSSAVSHTYASRTTYTVLISETGLTKFGDHSPCEEYDPECELTAFIVGDIKQLHIDGCASLIGVMIVGDDHDEENRGALTVLEINNCPALQGLFCPENQLTSLDVSGCTALQVLYCSDNQLASLNVSGCTALQELECENNQLASLNVSSNTALQELECENNQLASLNVSSNTALQELDCDNNQLASLNVSGLTALEYLDCDNNQLASLNVSGCTALQYLRCSDNQLTAQALNAIFTALPARTGSEYYAYADVSDNPGSAGCDKSIAANKNWHVQGVPSEPATPPPYAATTQMWSLGVVWSDVINHTALCNKETFNGGTDDAPVADCRKNVEGTKGYYYSWPFVNEHADELCPSPWRVPTSSDLAALAQSFGVIDSEFNLLPTDRDDALRAINSWGAELAGRFPNSEPLGEGSANYWSSEVFALSALSIHVVLRDAETVYGNYSEQRWGYNLRCVR